MQCHTHGDPMRAEAPADLQAHAVPHAPPAQQSDDAASLFSLLPEHVLQLVYSHLSNRDRCSMRAACKAGAIAFHGVKEATLTLQHFAASQQPQQQDAATAAQPAPHGSHAHQIMHDPQPLVVLAQRITALRHITPSLTSLTLDLSAASVEPDVMSMEQASVVLAACTGLHRLVVRGAQEPWDMNTPAAARHTVAAFGSSRAPCADALLDVRLCLPLPGARLGGNERPLVQQAMQNGWRLQCVVGPPSACAQLAASTWTGVQQVSVVANSVRNTPFGFTIQSCFLNDLSVEGLTQLAAALAAVPKVELQMSTGIGSTYRILPLLRTATRIVCLSHPALDSSILQNQHFHADVAAGAAPRLQALLCNIEHVPSCPPSLAASLQDLHVLLHDAESMDQMLTWQPGWLPSLHTLVIKPSPSALSVEGPHMFVLHAQHVSALAAAAPSLRVLHTSCVVAPRM